MLKSPFEDQLDKKDNVSFKSYDAITWSTNNYNTHIAQYQKTKNNQTTKFRQLIEYNKRKVFIQKSCRKQGRETSSKPLFVFLKNCMN